LRASGWLPEIGGIVLLSGVADLVVHGSAFMGG
jgi:hypothetical protein